MIWEYRKRREGEGCDLGYVHTQSASEADRRYLREEEVKLREAQRAIQRIHFEVFPPFPPSLSPFLSFLPPLFLSLFVLARVRA